MRRNRRLSRVAAVISLLALLVVQLAPALPMVQAAPVVSAMQDADHCETAVQCHGGLLCDHGCAACWHGFSASLTTFTGHAHQAPQWISSAVPVSWRYLPPDGLTRPPQVHLS